MWSNILKNIRHLLWNKVSCSPGWLQTHCVAKGNLKLLDPVSVSGILGLQAHTTITSLGNAGMKLRTSCMLGKHCTCRGSAPSAQGCTLYYFFWSSVLSNVEFLLHQHHYKTFHVIKYTWKLLPSGHCEPYNVITCIHNILSPNLVSRTLPSAKTETVPSKGSPLPYSSAPLYFVSLRFWLWATLCK